MVGLYGIKLGEKLKVEDINDWVSSGDNYLSSNTSIWVKTYPHFFLDRVVKSFGVQGGHPCFQVSGTSDTVWIKAQGFKDFISGEDFEWKVGDTLKVKDIRAWRALGKNTLYDENTLAYSTGKWEFSPSFVVGEREVKEISVKDGHKALLISETSGVWIKAQGFKEFIQGKEIPVKEEPKEGVSNIWYRAKNTNQLLFKSSKGAVYGFVNNNWGSNFICTGKAEVYDVADDFEVKESLVREAKIRGLENISEIAFKSPLSERIYPKGYFTTGSNEYMYHSHNRLTLDGVTIYKDGVWAEVLKVELPKIKGYSGEDLGDYIQYGCAELNKDWFRKSGNRSISHMELDSGIVLVEDDIENIRLYLKNKEEYDVK